jgi:hypothetical protein
MSRCVPGLLALLLAFGTAVAQDKPEDVIKKAVAAHGGDANLKKFPAGTSKIAGKVVGPDLPFTGAMAFSVPDKVRVEMTFEVAGQKASTLQIVNGQKVIQKENGTATKLSETAAAEVRESAAIQELALLYPLLGAKYTIAAGADATFDGKECATVVVKAKGLKDVTLAFDKKTGYLIAMQRRGVNPTQQPVDELTVFTDFKTIEGLVVPMKSKVSHDGKPFLEIAVTEYKPLAKVDDKLFTVE